MPEGKLGFQISNFSNKVCKLMDAEARVARLNRNSSPFSCTLIDAIQAGVVCGANRDPRPENCMVFPRQLPILRFPAELPCHLHETTLQYVQGQNSSFMWEHPDTVVTLPLINMLNAVDNSVPDTIATAVRDAESLTYLALYRAARMIYAAEGLTPPQRCGAIDTYRDFQVVPGWRTIQVINTLQPSRLGWDESQGQGSMNSDVSRNGIPVQSLRKLWSDFWDDGMKRAVAHALRDVAAMLNDPVSTYKAFAEIVSEITLPALLDQTGRRPVARWSQKQAEVVRLFKELAADATIRNKVGTEMLSSNPFIQAVPTVIVSQSPTNPCEWAIGVKGTTTLYEWWLDFNFWVTADPQFSTTHRGVQDIVHSVWPPLRETLVKLSAQHNCLCNQTRLLFFGHSLGGAVAGDLAMKAGIEFGSADVKATTPATLPRTLARPECPISIDVVMFSPLRSLQHESKEVFRRVVNARSLTDLNDPLTHLPCHTENSRFGYPRCPAGHAGFAGRGRDEYVLHTGIVWLDVDYRELWENRFVEKGISSTEERLLNHLMHIVLPPSIYEKLPQSIDFTAAHICSFSCALSAACQRQSARDWRWWCEDCIAI
eukprot:Protomagalhaensia_sp_Gyna_25__4569@NODE_420_length_3498_cov_54_755421_g323_i0_p1_GENE_NODE_420_length_3498_cov_54_755421_g323_i0NODE_420_length_3498_cov_54_755421_g323_i0_p1_ORF_typecomplete_len695_score103_75Lipase_3/PF01764_25/5e13DUF676/PF05057_14/0_013DUF676/PF05057_14/7_7e03DUF818/PF05677_12/0_02DUF2974/PF11187_8/0_08Chlorophyllase2/PF12740_7/0_089Chlorophyllase/PF07224_11/0_2Abhydrolase_6/PF12697_7/3_1e03Abhydrolase_6/PF12697_7/0_26Hydrolase_4/PF12146_8/3_9e03Hydrolase_4/PF12146_8/0_31PAFA